MNTKMTKVMAGLVASTLVAGSLPIVSYASTADAPTNQIVIRTTTTTGPAITTTGPAITTTGSSVTIDLTNVDLDQLFEDGATEALSEALNSYVNEAQFSKYNNNIAAALNAMFSNQDEIWDLAKAIFNEATKISADLTGMELTEGSLEITNSTAKIIGKNIEYTFWIDAKYQQSGGTQGYVTRTTTDLTMGPITVVLEDVVQQTYDDNFYYYYYYLGLGGSYTTSTSDDTTISSTSDIIDEEEFDIFEFEDIDDDDEFKAWVTAGPMSSSTTNPFFDVSKDAWYYWDIMNVYSRGIITGMTEYTFEPSATATRAQLATILNRLDGNTRGISGNNFSDVASEAWYSHAIDWAVGANIYSGFEDGTFRPNDEITREQLAVVMFNYARYKGYDTMTLGTISQFNDAYQVASYASYPLQWAVGNGLIGGTTGNMLNPKGTATRAEIASIVTRFINFAEQF